MASVELETAPEPEIQLEGGTYEIIRQRLRGHGNELRSRLERLNQARKDVFGSIDTALIATERITTPHNCMPRDMVAIGSRFLFGYNVHFGLKTETQLSDVFAVYQFQDLELHALPLEMIQDARFEKDFHDLYRYYREAQFARFVLSGVFLYMVFRVGRQVQDIKAFKWQTDGQRLVYVDNRSDHEVRYPPQHEFEWVRTHRDMHHAGPHPHISIDDRLFVETLGGDLTLKIENSTDTGEGIYSEDVEHRDQTLDDAEIYYALVGNLILLKIRPYQEKDFRYLVYNEKTQQARRLDAIEHACVLLPDDHGLIFPNGYYLQHGDSKTFDSGLSDMLFDRRIPAPNGEDYLYVFYNRQAGVYTLLHYNLIEQQADTPLICNGFTFFQAGELVCFKCHEQPQKHHPVQIWQTPYVGEDYVPPTNTDSYLYKVGNRDIVRGMAECHEVLTLIDREDTYADLYVDLSKAAGDIVDSYFWIDRPEMFDLKEVLQQIKQAASAAVDEFEKVVRVRQNTARQTQQVRNRTREILSAVHYKRFEQIGEFVESLADLRRVRGEVIALRDLRYADAALIESLEQEVAEQSGQLAQRCVQFLLREDALVPYQQQVDAERARIDKLPTVRDARQVEQSIAATAGELEMLIEVVSNLKIDDATQRTTIVDRISTIFATVNQARSALKNRARELMSVEGVAEFNAQMKLLNQGVVNYLDVCDTPDKCEEFLTRVMVQLEELDARFAEFDEFIVQLAEKRDEIYNAFETRRLALVEARNQRASALMGAAERILRGIQSRVQNFQSINDIHGYFASDLMIEKVRELVGQLAALDDTVKVDDIQSRLKTIREDAIRQLKDRQELYEDGQNVIRMGSHRFSVNVQALDLTTVLRDGRLLLHLTGTNFFEELEDDDLLATRDVWQQEVVSENRQVYRAEYLAYCLLQHLQNSQDPTPDQVRRYDEPQRLAYVQQFMGPRYSEAYSKGVHDHDAARILAALLDMQATVGLLRFHPRARALGQLFWQHFGDPEQKALMAARLDGFGTVLRLFPDTAVQQQYVGELAGLLGQFLDQTRLFPAALRDEAAEYLFGELTSHDTLCISRTAADLHDGFHSHLKQHGFADRFAESVAAVRQDPASCFWLLRDWVGAFLDHRAAGQPEREDDEYADEVAGLLLHGSGDGRRVLDGQVRCELTGLAGSHPVIQNGRYRLNYNHFTDRLGQYARQVVPRFERYVQRKKQLVDQARQAMRLDEFRPRVLTSFVRNKLIDSVYLPLIGDNLAKQLGAAGEQKRTDRNGLLLLVSPPGYGKTTLMEYVANRLGLIFMKINGPAIGHQVTSLDPAEAPNAAAREEMQRLNLALEMGDNVMIYLDDIQHCNPELLQKFISLCDAQRKIEGVYKGQPRTYDLRGRKVAVVMAGNPYTESGERFQIPDMLSNRADIYNLGEIIGETQEAFEMSYLENALTSNPVLSKLASRSQKDVYAVIKMAQHGQREGIELEGNYSLEELNELVATMQKLMRVRDVVLAVNRQYIRSAAQADEYRTEPPFKLQGSYRNMNRIAERVVPIMNDQELEGLILSNYENDAQTLTADTESNLLKLKELLGLLTGQEARRWADITRAFQQNVRLRGVGSDDKFGQVIVQLGAFNDGLESIRRAMTDGVGQLARQDGPTAVDRHLGALIERVGQVQEALTSIGQALASDRNGGLDPRTIKTLASELRQLGPALSPVPSDNASQRMIVQHKVPRSIMNVLESQFELMNRWLEPILKASQTQSTELENLGQSLSSCLDQYAALIQELDKARNRKKR